MEINQCKYHRSAPFVWVMRRAPVWCSNQHLIPTHVNVEWGRPHLEVCHGQLGSDDPSLDLAIFHCSFFFYSLMGGRVSSHPCPGFLSFDHQRWWWSYFFSRQSQKRQKEFLSFILFFLSYKLIGWIDAHRQATIHLEINKFINLSNGITIRNVRLTQWCCFSIYRQQRDRVHLRRHVGRSRSRRHASLFARQSHWMHLRHGTPRTTHSRWLEMGRLLVSHNPFHS